MDNNYSEKRGLVSEESPKMFPRRTLSETIRDVFIKYAPNIAEIGKTYVKAGELNSVFLD